APVASQLGSKRLLIVADGILQYVPFGALPSLEPRAAGDGDPGGDAPLIAEHEVVSLPSASVLAVLRQETAGRAAAPKTLAVLADPVFYVDDPRVAVRQTHPRTSVRSGAVTRSAAESGSAGFARLRFSRQEADGIARLVPEDKAWLALDFAANRAAATSAEIGRYAIVHFATHGLIDSVHPELSGIVLSLVDERG